MEAYLPEKTGLRGHPFRYSLEGFHYGSKYVLEPVCLLPPYLPRLLSSGF